MDNEIKDGVASPMRLDRELAIKAMQSMGWTTQRSGTGKKVSWRFTRPDTGGLWDRIDCKQVNLSMNWVAEMAMRYDDAPELFREIKEAKERWIKSRFVGLYAHADAMLPADSEGGDA